ncbi:MAG: hypothetical protein NTW31_12305 [Bacteroidetes bacterium]|nr:hypothetical protein [Bacteroidota bacterium]
MKIVINNHRKIFAIQEEFSVMFPELKIVFHAKPSSQGGVPSSKLVVHSSRKLQDCRSISREGTIEVMQTMSISDLKGNLRDIFGLSAEIFRKAENGEDEKPISGKHTLGEINKESEAHFAV